jgi:hypothetical protein
MPSKYGFDTATEKQDKKVMFFARMTSEASIIDPIVHDILSDLVEAKGLPGKVEGFVNKKPKSSNIFGKWWVGIPFNNEEWQYEERYRRISPGLTVCFGHETTRNHGLFLIYVGKNFEDLERVKLEEVLYRVTQIQKGVPLLDQER